MDLHANWLMADRMAANEQTTQVFCSLAISGEMRE